VVLGGDRLEFAKFLEHRVQFGADTFPIHHKRTAARNRSPRPRPCRSYQAYASSTSAAAAGRKMTGFMGRDSSSGCARSWASLPTFSSAHTAEPLEESGPTWPLTVAVFASSRKG
jgi:hypothetical protein